MEDEKKYILIKLYNDIEIIGTLLEENDQTLVLDHPVMIDVSHEGQRMFPYSVYTHRGEFTKRSIAFRGRSELVKPLKVFYEKYLDKAEELDAKADEEDTEEEYEPIDSDSISNNVLADFFSDIKPGTVH